MIGSGIVTVIVEMRRGADTRKGDPKSFILCDSMHIIFRYGKISEIKDRLVVAKDQERRGRETEGSGYGILVGKELF